MRPVDECWLQTPEILKEEIEVRVRMLSMLVGQLYLGIVLAEIATLREILRDREADLAKNDVPL